MSIRENLRPIVAPYPGRTARRERRGEAFREWWERKGFGEMWNPRMLQGDLILVVIVVTLICIGLLMIYSASLPGVVLEKGKPLNHYFLRQLLWVAIGLVVMLICWKIRYTFWRNWAILILFICIVALVGVLLFGQGDYGSRRYLFSKSIQQSEMVKLASIIYLSIWMASKGDKLRELGFGFVPFSILIGVIAGLIIAEPDRSTGFLLIVVAAAMFFVAGADMKQFLIAVPVGGAVIWVILQAADYSDQRLQEFLASWRNPLAGEPSQMQDFVKCLQSGGLFGKGLANGVAKHSASVIHSDGIMAVVGEEFGLIGCLVVTGLFILLAYRGIAIARNAPDQMGLIMASGITFWLVFQAFINIAVVTGLVPTTGIPLTFVSYGGSALVMALAGVGVLLSISCSPYEEEMPTHARASERWGNRWSRLPYTRGR